MLPLVLMRRANSISIISIVSFLQTLHFCGVLVFLCTWYFRIAAGFRKNFNYENICPFFKLQLFLLLTVGMARLAVICI